MSTVACNCTTTDSLQGLSTAGRKGPPAWSSNNQVRVRLPQPIDLNQELTPMPASGSNADLCPVLEASNGIRQQCQWVRCSMAGYERNARSSMESAPSFGRSHRLGAFHPFVLRRRERRRTMPNIRLRGYAAFPRRNEAFPSLRSEDAPVYPGAQNCDR